jgi:hypothetical protein
MTAAPILFDAALDTAQAREIIASALSSAQLRTLDADLLRGAVFSARTTDARYVQAIKLVVEDMLAGKINRAAARGVLQNLLAQLGYTPEAGFAGDAAKGVPPAERGSLRDLASETRIDLVLDTQVRMMTGAGYRLAGQEPSRLYQYPCWELVRISPRRVPRGSADSHTEGWPARWRAVGGRIFDGRMIARKDDEIWNRLGDPATFDDGLGNPYPPFAFNSGMGVREVARGDAEALGVLDARTRVAEMPVDLARHFRDEAKNFDPEVLAELKKEADIILEENRQKSTLEIALERRRASYGIHKAGGAQ